MVNYKNFLTWQWYLWGYILCRGVNNTILVNTYFFISPYACMIPQIIPALSINTKVISFVIRSVDFCYCTISTAWRKFFSFNGLQQDFIKMVAQHKIIKRKVWKVLSCMFCGAGYYIFNHITNSKFIIWVH